MWPLDLPACDVLKLSDDTAAPWAVFDAGWYERVYGDAIREDGARHAFQELRPEHGDPPADCTLTPVELLQYYLETGQKIGHSPNRFFDEAWHLAAYPQIARAVAEGHYSSAFDAYCRCGSIDRSAHWLFDELAYRGLYPDLTNEVLAGSNLVNGYDHYLRHGIEEDRIGHPMFDPAIYLANFDAADVPAIRGMGAFQHYLNRIETGEPELQTSIYFDPAWYLARYPEVAEGIAAGRWRCALHHYLCNDQPTEFDPLASFSEEHYLSRAPGLRDVIEAGHFRNGYMHFLKFGAQELRSPAPSIDLRWYAEQPSVRADLEQGRAPDAFAHWLTIGLSGSTSSAAPEAQRITVPLARALARQQASALLPVVGRFGFSFESATEPMVSVVLVVRDGFAATIATIASLQAEAEVSVELVIVDQGSADETRSIGQYVAGARILRFESEIGWARAADAGRQFATGEFVLFLSNDSRIVHGSIARAHARLAGDPAAGAVGGMIIQPSGIIGQAGGIIWNDGGTHDYQRGESPLSPEANFVRAVDFCSPAFLLVRADVLKRLDGFDHACTDGYEIVDLCLRISQLDLQVIYDPSVVLFDSADIETLGGAGAHFRDKHAASLVQRFEPNGEVQAFARHAGPQPRRILFIEDTVPLRRIGSGFVRSNDIVYVMDALDFAVTVYPVSGCPHDRARVFGDMPEAVEVMHDHDVSGLAAFLAGRSGYYDTIWIARAHNLDRISACLPRDVPLIVLDTEAVAPAREAKQARLAARPYDIDAGMRAMLRNADLCHRTVAVTEAEAEMLRAYGAPDVSVIGHMIEPRPTLRAYDRRAGMLFAGAFHTTDSPNLDSLVWFVEDVLPLIEAELGWETRLTIAGYTAPGVDLDRFANHPRITLRGTVADLEPLYDACRVFIAPTRFAAGAPYKVFEAASYGVPVVATELLRGQLGWGREQEILSAAANDPAAFAACVVALYRNEALWQAIRDGALRRLESNCSTHPSTCKRLISNTF
ncbi:MAG: glycosyltransferase [Rhodopila sp.]